MRLAVSSSPQCFPGYHAFFLLWLSHLNVWAKQLLRYAAQVHRTASPKLKSQSDGERGGEQGVRGGILVLTEQRPLGVDSNAEAVFVRRILPLLYQCPEFVTNT